MKILTLLFSIICSWLMCSSSLGQRSIIYNKKGRLVTTDTIKGITYLGSPYLGDIIWHQGYLIYRNQREIPAKIAYNIVFDQIFWRLNDSTDVVQALPDEFTFEGRRFIADPYKVLKVKRVTYFEVLYDGKTRLFRRWTKRLRPIDWKLYTSRVLPEDRFAAEYILTGDLYIQKEGERPKFIIPTEYSLSRFLPNMGSDLANFIASHELTDQVLVEALIQYDKRPDSLTH
ncbi:hypothetical protein GO755_07305 [Spirosoma sp. HMF4905]|uniref:Uncharacterized protein n=1 Tax=Spirosoma arboris TaxID=2682092 RepID=A0A7K1S7L6_9BACT|nr:hypothetical protein [Spirosoma arboris]MVM29833.1 hypothetical protein [Spirosoma arboris]